MAGTLELFGKLFEFVGIEPKELAPRAQIEMQVSTGIDGKGDLGHRLTAGRTSNSVGSIGLMGLLPQRSYLLRRRDSAQHSQGNGPPATVLALEEKP